METNSNIVKDIQQIVEENKVQVIEVGDRRFSTKQHRGKLDLRTVSV